MRAWIVHDNEGCCCKNQAAVSEGGVESTKVPQPISILISGVLLSPTFCGVLSSYHAVEPSRQAKRKYAEIRRKHSTLIDGQGKAIIDRGVCEGRFGLAR